MAHWGRVWPVPSFESTRGAEAAGRQPKGFALPIFWRISGQPLHLLMSQTPQSALWAASVLTRFKINLFLAALGARCCAGFSLVGARRGYPLVAVCGLLIAVASLVAERRLEGTQASVVATPRL